MDHLPAAVRTYRDNVENHVRIEEISESTQIAKADVVAGGPPCQGFSSAGLRRAGDARNSLVSVFSTLVAREKPAAFVFENVEGFLTTDDGDRVLDLLEPLIAAGYRVHLREDQCRKLRRSAAPKASCCLGGLGMESAVSRGDTRRPSERPARNSGGGRDLPPTPSLVDALCDLPPASRDGDVSIVEDHIYKSLSDEVGKTRRVMEQGQRMRDLPKSTGTSSYRRRAYRRVMDGTPTERRGERTSSGVRRLRGDQPSKAITGGARSEFLHPTENRNLTLRECARIQTFPDSFRFIGLASERAFSLVTPCPLAWLRRLERVLQRRFVRARPRGNTTTAHCRASFRHYRRA